jgi:outer membrane autotransporter protein
LRAELNEEETPLLPLGGSLLFQLNPNIDNSGTAYSVFIFGQPGTTGAVNGPSFNQAFTLGENGFTTIALPLAQQLSPGVVQDRGFQVDANAPVSGYLLNRRPASTDMTFLINGERLGSDYYTLGYQNIRPDQISVQAVQDNTQVTFTTPSGGQVNVTLNAGQTYLLNQSADLTGTRVTGSAPIAVFSGNQCANIPSNNTACDHLVEQMPSIDQLSSQYFLSQSPRTGSGGDVVRIVATADNTQVQINGTQVASLNAGQFYEGRVVGGLQLTATNPILVGQYLIGSSQGGENTDPAMTIVPGADQWLSEYVFSPPLGAANFPEDFISVIMQTNDISTLMIDGVMANGALFNPIANSVYSYASFNVSDKNGPFSIVAASPFQLLLMGFDSFDSYFTYGGAAFAPGASPPADNPPPPPPPPPPSATPNVFWDGDGNPDNDNVEGGDGILTRTSGNLTREQGDINNSLPVVPANIIFGGMPGTVTIDTSEGEIPVAGLRFRVNGYTITGDQLTLAGSGGGNNVIIETAALGGTMMNGEGEGEETPINDADITALIESNLVGTGGITKIGAGTLVLTGINSFTGGTNLLEGTLIGNSSTFGTGAIANGATLVFNQLTNGIFGNGIYGTGTLIKRGAGRLTIIGDNSFLTGATRVEQGLLQVDGNLSGSIVTVQSGARIGGIGTVGGLIVRNGATAAPGQSIGTLNVAGNVLFETGSTYEVELNSLGQADRIIATGTAAVQTGTTLRVIKVDAPRLVLNTRYTVLTANATNGRTGSFTTLTGDTRVSQFINLTQTTDANNIYLNVAKTRAFSAAGLTANQIAAATGADAAGNGNLFTSIAYLQTDAEARAAFDLISGELHASARSVAVEDSRFIREAVTNRLVESAGQDRALWMSGYGSWGDLDGTGNSANLRRSIGGFFLGGEVFSNDSFTLGAVTGYGQGNINVSARGSTANTKDFHAGAYAGVRLGGFNAKLAFAHMWRDISTNRIASFTGFSNVLQANYDQRILQGLADVGYSIPLGSASVEPFGSVAWVRVSSDAFQEAGGTAALNVAKTSENFAVTNLGLRLGYNGQLKNGRIGLNASAAWRHVGGGDLENTGSMRFIAGPLFSVNGTPIAKDAAALSAQLSGMVGNGVSLAVGYSGQIGKSIDDHGIKGNVTIRF